MYYMFIIAPMTTAPIPVSKTVTIRDVNKELYEHFTTLATRFGDNLGQVFSRLIQSYGKPYNPLFLLPGARARFAMLHDHSSIEVIRDCDELVISKSDLEEAGADLHYIFRNIGHLVFDESVDNRTLMRHVLRIHKSNVETRGDVSRLFLKSINQSQMLSLYFQDLNPETTNITIRNVDEQTYSEFSTACQTARTKIGQAVNDLLKRSLPYFEISQILLHDPKLHDPDLIVLMLHEHLEVTPQDLQDLEGRKVLFHRIRDLIFSDSTDPKLFKDTVMGIYNCPQVIYPAAVPRLIRLSRTRSYP